LLISNDILSEYAEKLAEKTSQIVSFNISEFLAQSNHVEQIEIYYRWHLIERDVDDNKFVDCAVSGNADYLITDDKHFRKLKEVGFPIVEVLRTAAFLEIIKNI